MRKYLSLLLLAAVVAPPIAYSQTPTPSASPKHRRTKKTENASPSPASSPVTSATPEGTPKKPRAKKSASPSPSPAAVATPTPATAASPEGTPKKPRAKKSAAPATSPVTVATPTPVPSPTAKNPLSGIFGKKASPSPAPVTSGTPGAGQVWVNTENHTYHKPGSQWYGKTKQGKYVSEQEAIKEGDHSAKNEQPNAV